MSHSFDLSVLRERVQAQIDSELIHHRGVLAELGADVTPLVEVVESLLRGGKRLRAAFCYVGYLAAGGTHLEAALRAATAMELFQAAALLHDDVMDDSATRRGRPTAHRALAERHLSSGWEGDGDRFGTAGAILAGDLCLVWTDEMFAGCGLPQPELDRARPVFDAMRSQLMAGQFLDVLVSVQGWHGLGLAERLDQASKVIRYKSAKYSIEHPLLIGAEAGGVESRDAGRLSGYGLDLGEAFQLRDDILGVFGDPQETGKPAGDDLREGKRTVLLAYALDGADPGQTAVLESGLGDPDLGDDEVNRMRTVILDSGAVQHVEARIDHLTTRAAEALAATEGLTQAGRQALGGLIDVATARES